MTKRIPKKERRLEWEEEELRRRMLRRNDAADALEKAEADLQTQERIVALMRGEEFGSSTFGTGDSIVWGPDGNPLIPVEPLVGQPGALERNKTLLPDNTPYGDVPVHVQVGEADVAFPASKIAVEGGTDSGGTLPITRQEAIDRAIDVMHTAEAKRDEAARIGEATGPQPIFTLLPDVGPNGGSFLMYLAELEGIQNAALSSKSPLAKVAGILALEEAERLSGLVAQPLLAERDKGADATVSITPSELRPHVIVTQGLLNVPVQEKKDCTPPRHYFSDAKGLPIGTPCFCGVRQWGVDPAKDGRERSDSPPPGTPTSSTWTEGIR